MNQELTNQESHNLAMNIVGVELEKEGYEFLAINSDLKKNPQFVALKNKKTSFILVRAVSDPDKLNSFNHISTEAIVEHSKEYKAKVFYAGVWLGHGSDINNPVINGEDYSYVFTGLIEIK